MDPNSFWSIYPDAISGGFDAFIKVFGPIVAALAAVGIVTKAAIDFGKDVIPLRRWWQRNWVHDWVMAKTVKAEAGSGLDALKQLELLAAAGDGKALYGQTAEKLVGLINAALQMALDAPTRYPELIVAFSTGGNEEDLRRVLDGRPETTERSDLDKYVAARNRIASHVQRSLDGMLIAMADQWKRRLQLISILLSSAFIFGAASAHGSIKTGGDTILWFLVALGGGLLAPGINDFAKTLTGFRKRG